MDSIALSTGTISGFAHAVGIGSESRRASRRLRGHAERPSSTDCRIAPFPK